MPNTPGTLGRPPPRRKEEATAELLLRTLPSPDATGALLALLSVVSYEGGEPVRRGGHPVIRVGTPPPSPSPPSLGTLVSGWDVPHVPKRTQPSDPPPPPTSNSSSDPQRPLGSRSEELFSGAAPRRLLASFRRRLAAISHRIRQRNEGLALPYPYLDPACVQESVAI